MIESKAFQHLPESSIIVFEMSLNTISCFDFIFIAAGDAVTLKENGFFSIVH